MLASCSMLQKVDYAQNTIDTKGTTDTADTIVTTDTTDTTDRGVARISRRGVLKNFSAAALAAYAHART